MGAVLGFAATVATASTIDTLVGSGTVVHDGVNGSVAFIGLDYVDPIFGDSLSDFGLGSSFAGNFGTDPFVNPGEFVIDAPDLSDPTIAAFTFNPDPATPDPIEIFGIADFEIDGFVIKLLFKDGDTAWLAEFDITNSGLGTFGDASAIDTDVASASSGVSVFASVSLTQYDIAPIPLPAGAMLLVTGVAGLGAMRRASKKSA